MVSSVRAPQALSSFVEPLRQLCFRSSEGPWLASDVQIHHIEAQFDEVVGLAQYRSPVAGRTSEGQSAALLESIGPLTRVYIEGSSPRWMLTRRVRRILKGNTRWVVMRPAPHFSSLTSPPEGTLSPLRRTLRLLALDKGDMTVVVIYGMGIGFLSLSVPIAVQALVNTVAFGTLLQPLFVLSGLLALALLGAMALRVLQLRVVEMFQRRLYVRIVSELSARLPQVDFLALRKHNGPELLNRFFDLFTIQKAVAGLLLEAVDAVLIAIVGMVVLAFYHPSLLAFDIVLLIAAVFVFWGMSRNGTETSVLESKAKYATAAWLEEMARNPLSFKLAGGSDCGQRNAQALAVRYLKHRSEHFRVFFRQFVGAQGLQMVGSVSLLALGGMLVIERQLSIGQLVAAELIVFAVVASIVKLGSKVEVYYDLVAAADKLGHLFDLPLEEESEREELLPQFSEGVTIEDVTGDRLKRSLSLRIEPGEIKIVGDLTDTECEVVGDMLFGLRTPHSGAIHVFGADARDVTRSSLRRVVALVRHPEIIPDTIFENLRIGDAELTKERAWRLLSEVSLDQRIRALPEGLNTLLHPTFTPLNRREALKLTIARALASRPRLLVLDRALDRINTEQRARLCVQVQAGGHTSILVLTVSGPTMHTEEFGAGGQ